MSQLSLLGLRFSWGDAQPLLDALRPAGRVLFSLPFALFVAFLLLVGIALGVGRADQVAAMLPRMGTFLSQTNLWLLVASWIVIKALHELGHGLACRRFGGECHEFGVQLIVFFPFAYCDVSDVWMLPNRWQRMIVSAAGMYVELILATIGMFLWYFSEPGLFNSIVFNLVVLCSINTLLFNGNPLLRFDGYYILADWLEVPNLHTQAKSALLHPLQSWLMPGRLVEPRYDGSRWKLASFALLAFAYRVFTMGIIAWTIYQFLSKYHLAPLADALLALLIAGMMLPVIVGAVKIMRHPVLRKSVRKLRFAVLMAGVCLLGWLLLSCPWDRTLRAPAVIQMQDTARLYVTAPGQLSSHVALGSDVETGEVVAQLENHDLERRVLEYRSRAEELTAQLANLQIQELTSPHLAAEIAATEASLEQARQQLAAANEEVKKLTIRSPRAGAVLPELRQVSFSESLALRAWDGSALSPENVDCHLEAGQVIALVGKTTELEALLLLSQDDTEQIVLGTPVELRMEQSPTKIWQGTIRQISRNPVEEIPPAILAEGSIAMRLDATGKARPTKTHYFATVAFDSQPAGVLPASIGRAKVVLSESTIGHELLRTIRRVFYFDFKR